MPQHCPAGPGNAKKLVPLNEAQDYGHRISLNRKYKEFIKGITMGHEDEEGHRIWDTQHATSIASRTISNKSFGDLASIYKIHKRSLAYSQ